MSIVQRSSESIDTFSGSTLRNGVHIETLIFPAHRGSYGGDWCESFFVSDDVIAFSVGDACGHGPQAFPAMLIARDAIRQSVRCGLDPAQTLIDLNDALVETGTEAFVTAILAFLDTRTGLLSLVNAGHPPPLIVRASDAAFVLTPNAGLPLGCNRSIRPAADPIVLPVDALLVLYTDGVTEHDRNPLRGEAQLRHAARVAHRATSAPAARAIADDLDLGRQRSGDDAAILTARTPDRWARRR